MKENDYLTEVKERNPLLYQDLVTAQEKARLYLWIVAGAIIGLFLFLLVVMIFSFWGKGIIWWLVLLLFLSLAIVRIKIVQQMDRVVVEVLGNYYTTWGPGIHIFVRWLMRPASEISLKEQSLVLFPNGEKLDVEQARVGVVATATIRATNPLLVSYGVAGDEAETGPAKIKQLMRMKVQDGIQTLIRKEGMSYDDVINLRGNDVRQTLWEDIEGLKEAFENWGAVLEKTLFEDFDPPQEEASFRRKVFEMDRQKEIKRKEVEVKKLEGEAEAERIKTIIWELAKRESGVIKKDGELTQEEIQQILKYFDAARSTYLEDRSISAVQPTDKVVITEGKGIGKMIGRDVAREYIGRATTEKEENKKSK